MSVILDAFSNGGRSSARKPADLQSDPGDWHQPETPKRDTKKFFLVLGLGLLSWVATYVGMLELIEANMGELPLIHKLIIGFSVAMLMTMIVWLLDQMFAPIGFFSRLIYASGYVFLSVISIGFGFGFYWKVLESRSEASRSAESAVTQVQGALNSAATRLEQLNGTLVSLTAISTQKAEQERANGTSCPNSKPGEGPRRKMREDDAARFSFASDFVKGRVTAVKSEMSALDVDLAKIVKDDKSTIDAKSGTRNDFMRGLGRKLDMTVTGFNAFRTDPQLKQIRSDLAERSEKTTIADGRGGSISCPDPQLQGALKGVVRAIDQLPELQKPTIAAVEGSEATIEAFRRLTTSFFGLLTFKMPPSADELRALQQKAVQSVETPTAAVMKSYNGEQAGLSKRDYVPLAIAIFVDICLLLVSMGRPMNRLQGLVPKMQAAERGPVYQILSRFTDIHADADMRQKFEVFRHVVFDYGGDYYVAVPLDAPWNRNPREQQELLAEAHLLSNLFSSFEKEMIFKRVYSPLLKTSSIQKKLGRQGSKFAHCKAFRIYRFADGAWSEIILGAVMGAAKRVEAEKKRRRTMDEATARTAPQAPGHGSPGFSSVAGAFEELGREMGLPPHAMQQPSAQTFAPPHYAMQGQPTAPHYQAEASPGFRPPMQRKPGPGYAPGYANVQRPLQRELMPQAMAQAPMSAPVAANDTVSAFGPYAQYQPDYATAEVRRPADVAQWSTEVARREADVSVRAVETNEGLARQHENVVIMPVNRAVPLAQPSVGVELTRETIRYTVPASEAVLPAGLAHLKMAHVDAPVLVASDANSAAFEYSDDLLIGDDRETAAMAAKFATSEQPE